MRFTYVLLCSVLLCSCASYPPGYRANNSNNPELLALGPYARAIHDKIQQNIPALPDVPSDAITSIKVFLSPTGEVMSVSVIRSSEFPKYDEAVKQALYKASPLPVPNDPNLFKEFRQFQLNVKRSSY